MHWKTDIPVIDLKPWFNGNDKDKSKLCERINQICHEVGFFYVVNHKISKDHCDEFMHTVRRFFALPETEKSKIDKIHSPHFRGWEKLGSELTNNQIDYREQLDIGIDRVALDNPDPYYLSLIGPNQWPDESLIPGFQTTVNGFIDQLCDLSEQILKIMSRALGLKENHIQSVFAGEPGPYAKLIRYPKTIADGQGVGTHKDSGFLTLLLQDASAGLQAQANNGKWLDVAPVCGSFVVNTGELLQLLTHNYFIATPHRVVNKSNESRYSCAFFYSPDLNAALDPLPIHDQYIAKAKASPRHSTEGLMPSRTEMAQGVEIMASMNKPAIFGEKYWQRWVRSYPEIAKKYYPDLMH